MLPWPETESSFHEDGYSSFSDASQLQSVTPLEVGLERALADRVVQTEDSGVLLSGQQRVSPLELRHPSCAVSDV